MPNDTAAAPATAPVASTGDPITAALTAGFAALEAPAEIDNSNVEDTPEVTPSEVPDAPAPAEEPETPEDDPEAIPEEDAPEGEEADDEESDDATESADYLTSEQIEEKFKVSNTKALRILTAQYSEDARKGAEAIDSIGGEPFLVPMAEMSQSLQAAVRPDAAPGALVPFFQGIVKASGDEALVKVIGQSLYMGFVQGPTWSENPATKAFGEALNGRVEEAFQARFGTSIDDVARMAEFAKVGWIEKIAKWTEDNFVPEEELEEMLKINNDPVLKRLAEENTALKGQQGKPGAEDTATNKDLDIENSFGDYIGERTTSVVENVLLKGSPLKDVEGDTPEMKTQKAFFRGSLADKAQKLLTQSADKKDLLNGFRNGNKDTSTYQSALVTAFDTVLKAVNADKVSAENTIKQLYGKTRNAKLIPKTNNTPPPIAPKTPTVPTDFAPPANGIKTTAEIQKQLEEGFAALG